MPVALKQFRLDGVRAIFAALLVIVPFLHPLMHAPVGRTALDGQGVFSVICNLGPSTDHAPGKQAVPFKEHCLLCSLQIIAQPVRIVFVIALANNESEAKARIFPSALDDALPVPSGWSSNWSSQGPPSFS